MGCCSGVVTQAYGQPDNPVLHRGGRIVPLPYLPPRHFADCHNRKRTVELNLTTSLIGEGLRRTLSCYALTFQGYILSVNCQCRMLTRVRRTTTRGSVLVSIFNPEPKWRIKCQNNLTPPAETCLSSTTSRA